MHRRNTNISQGLTWLTMLMIMASNFVFNTAAAKSAAEINIEVTETLNRFKREVSGGGKFLQRASGVLV